ncbi:hypothetical protein Micbo1qcDRAFT_51022 [Microdochium bolleyi]|uniref:FAD-binding FR-type domain-containing protein n=1 Tax=Microdochium bolleyi TaxID=196109 RepID=A0A136J6H7_9PEZI|nr:hypothetical protein Micbo1qcDRAFT_51022 [Microdochium bolleyi]
MATRPMTFLGSRLTAHSPRTQTVVNPATLVRSSLPRSAVLGGLLQQRGLRITAASDKMGEKGVSVPHLERTAGEPREKSLIPVVVQRIDCVNDQTRLFRLAIPQSAQPVKFRPGQWLDVYCPGIAKAGGFTLTSSPSKAVPRSGSGIGDREDGRGYLELAVQRSPGNPPAAWLWQDHENDNGDNKSKSPSSSVIGQEIKVRIGGSFVWPPPGIDTTGLKKVVFVAGGVGVNPLMSMLSYLAEEGRGREQHSFQVEFFYSVRDPSAAGGRGDGERRAEEILFLERIVGIFEKGEVQGRLRLFLTGSQVSANADISRGELESASLGTRIPFTGRRVAVDDIVSVLTDQDEALRRDTAVIYICGVPGMTDEFVGRLTDPDGIGMPRNRVLCEKWW